VTIEGRLTGLGLVLGLLFAACANDTGRPRQVNGRFEDVPTNPPMIVVPPAGSKPPVGATGTSGAMAPPMTAGDPRACLAVEQNASGLFSVGCVECTCNLNASATASCTFDCWQLLACVAHNCAKTDTNCIIQRCNPSGDLSALAATGNLARAVPIEACASECFPDLVPEEAGIENDF
jgi:hypothetical protein